MNSGSGWETVSTGVTNSGSRTSLLVTATENNNGYQYKVVLTPFRGGDPVTSAVATLTTGNTDTPLQTQSFFFTQQPLVAMPACIVATFAAIQEWRLIRAEGKSFPRSTPDESGRTD